MNGTTRLTWLEVSVSSLVLPVSIRFFSVGAPHRNGQVAAANYVTHEDTSANTREGSAPSAANGREPPQPA
eukprot:m.326876 g.326876  ORF g.326876 m.326876 type:complete len:71 (+) comp16488_c0_seq1:2295-2507(+)